MNNTPTLTQSEEEIAPWNDKNYKYIEVTISQTLSCIKSIIVPIDFDESDNKALEREVTDQVVLPSDALLYEDYNDWDVDDFCVAL